MPFCEVNGVSLFYSDQGQGECLVLLHGLGQNITSWENQIRELALTHRVVSLDLRGHGHSGDNEETITINLLAEDLAGLLDHLEIERVHLCGLSMGGLIALEFYKLYPGKVRSLILANTFANIPEPHRTLNLQQWLEMLDELSMEEYGKIFALNCLSKQVSAETYMQVAEMFGNNRKAPYQQALIAVYSADYTNLLPLIKVPVLVITGELDKNAPLSFAQKLADNIKNSRLVVLKNAGHLSNLEQPAEFNTVLKNFMEEVK